MTWTFNPFTGTLDYYEGFEVTNHSSDIFLGIGDLGKYHIMDVSGGERAFWLPNIGASHINKWVILARKGTGNLLRIWAGTGDKILNSTSGGYIECNEAAHDYSSILLIVIADGQWGNPSFGIWETH